MLLGGVMKTAREYWIETASDEFKTYNRTWVLDEWQEECDSDLMTHVIEKSAYDKAIAALKYVVCDLSDVVNGVKTPIQLTTLSDTEQTLKELGEIK
jgi:hypothetical protein